MSLSDFNNTFDENETNQSLNSTKIIQIKGSIDSDPTVETARERSVSGSSTSSKRRNQNLRKLLDEVKSSQLKVQDL